MVKGMAITAGYLNSVTGMVMLGCKAAILTNGIGSMWCAGGKHSYTLAIQLGNLHFGLEASVIRAPQILQISVTMEICR